MAKNNTSIWFKLGIGAIVIIAGLLTLLYTLRVAYTGRIFPGVYGDGIYLGGLTKAEATKLIDTQLANYQKTSVGVRAGNNSQTYAANDLIGSNDAADLVDQLYSLGRNGNALDQMSDQVGLLLFGSDKTVSSVSLSPKAAEVLSNMANSVARPVSNANFTLNGNQLVINPAQPGQRLQLGLAALQLQSQLGQFKKDISLSTTTLNPQIDSALLGSESSMVEPFIQTPLTLTAAGKSFQIDPQTIIGWLNVSSPQKPSILNSLGNIYNQQIGETRVGFDRNQIVGYLGGLTSQINQDAQDAQLTISGGKATVFTQSRDGQKLNVPVSADAILQALSGGQNSGPVKLAVDIQKAAVSSDTIDQLGIKELISEGVTYFPNSPANRMTNIRIATSRFQGALIKPGQVFSFGDTLGPAGPEQGYTPSLVILENHEEKGYGGGICQVSSTLYRAALLAGLPILERTNHAFAVNYYTAPYGVPGVDATIYYPPVDLKFKNDTGHYILIQTHLEGMTLKFDLYGTKTKSGAIRGPFFVSGSLDATKPSQTVFYRDILDLSGKVVKTDTINTYYKSSLDFPVTD